MKHFCKDFFFLIYSTLIFLTKDIALWLVFFFFPFPLFSKTVLLAILFRSKR